MLIETHLHYTKSYYFSLEGRFEFWPCKIEGDKDKMFIQTLMMEVDDSILPSPEEINHYLITGLRKQKEELQAETHRKIMDIEEQIQKLLALPAFVEVPVEVPIDNWEE